MEKGRNTYDIASDIDDVLVGLERAEKAVYKVFENYHSDVNGFAKKGAIGRMADYETALMLSMDRIFDERKKLEKLSEELYDLHKNSN